MQDLKKYSKLFETTSKGKPKRQLNEAIELDGMEKKVFDAVIKNQDIDDEDVETVKEIISDMGEHDLVRVYLNAKFDEGHSGFDILTDDPDRLDIEIIEDEREFIGLAKDYVEEGAFGDIDEKLMGYINYQKLAEDIKMDWSSVDLGGVSFWFREL